MRKGPPPAIREAALVCGVAAQLLLKIRLEKALDPVERNFFKIVVQVNVTRAGDDEQFLVLALEQFEGVLANCVGDG